MITRPPENTTACRGSDVTISCGYQNATALSVTWIINETFFSEQKIVDSSLYQLNNPGNTSSLSLTVFSINYTTILQCIIHSTPNTTISTPGTITVTTSMCSIYAIMIQYVCLKLCTVNRKIFNGNKFSRLAESTKKLTHENE